MAKYITPQQFIDSTIGKAYDMDGSYGVQCVDGIKKFAYDVYGEYKFDCGSCGYAYGLWTNYGTNGVEKYFNKHSFSEARKGDWIIWNWGSKGCAYSHVAMFDSMKTNDIVNSYGQSQNGIKAFNMCPIYTDGILGVLRPKIYEDDFFPYKGYYEYGDSGANVSKINDWYAEQVKGDFFGVYTMNCTEALQTKAKEDGIYDDVVDGKFGPKTLDAAKHYGFKE